MSGRGQPILENYAKRLRDEKLAVTVTTRCEPCGQEWHGPLSYTSEQFKEHRKTCHPHLRQVTNHKRRGHGQMIVSEKTLAENIDNVRQQGGHWWDQA